MTAPDKHFTWVYTHRETGRVESAPEPVSLADAEREVSHLIDWLMGFPSRGYLVQILDLSDNTVVRAHIVSKNFVITQTPALP